MGLKQFKKSLSEAFLEANSTLAVQEILAVRGMPKIEVKIWRLNEIVNMATWAGQLVCIRHVGLAKQINGDE